jgi:membrane fusion protein, multidrug efflux system
MSIRAWVGSLTLLAAVAAAGYALAEWKKKESQKAAAIAAAMPEPVESIRAAVAVPKEHRRMTTSVGTVVAMRSITLSNEVAGTVREVKMVPGDIVEAGAVLVALDVSVEDAELRAQEAEAALAETMHGRMHRASESRAASKTEVDRAKAQLDVARAQIARTQAIIAKKTIRAPFRARVGMTDVHPGQYLQAGTVLTTLQGMDESVHVDFAVAQTVAAGLREGGDVEVFTGGNAPAIPAKIVAIDARIDAVTRNAWVRARIDDANLAPRPGAAVRIQVAVGEPLQAVAVPVTALRKGPGGDHVFVLTPDKEGRVRAHVRPVTSGSMLGDDVLVLSGLESGERIAAAGSFKLREGLLVAVQQDAKR